MVQDILITVYQMDWMGVIFIYVVECVYIQPLHKLFINTSAGPSLCGLGGGLDLTALNYGAKPGAWGGEGE